jgi:hypothetical protein
MTRLLVNVTLAGSILLLSSTPISAQPPKSPDAATLRTKFVAAFGKDFDLVRDEMKTASGARGGSVYWLAFVKPRRMGHFYLQYRHQESNPLESTEHEVRVSIGPEKCRRGTPSGGVYTRFCLNDTLIIPVLVDTYRGHEFKLVKAEYTKEKKELPGSTADPPGLNKSPIENPASPTLRYAGRAAQKSMHRAPGYTLGLIAEFVAASPGRLNLLVSPFGSETGLRGRDNVPIIVLPLGAPATLIAGREEVRGYRKGSDGTDYRSTSSNSFMTNVLILQPGDRVSVPYFSIVRSSEYVGGRFNISDHDPAEDLEPVIKVRPFAPHTGYDFTEWIVEYLAK